MRWRCAVAGLVLLLAWPTVGAWAGPGVVQDEAALRRLVAGTTWQLPNLTGLPGDEYWDFNRDGTMCFRLAGARSDPCTDTGRWRIEGADLCWKLSWFGKSDGLNAPCVQIEALGQGRYEMIAGNELKRHWKRRPFKVLER